MRKPGIAGTIAFLALQIALRLGELQGAGYARGNVRFLIENGYLLNLHLDTARAGLLFLLGIDRVPRAVMAISFRPVRCW
uniref:Putative secreted protein n=1 Tax=Anopheles triannulatus TaxID=58253 RepID=A0A2M4B6A6_9DIPT